MWGCSNEKRDAVMKSKRVPRGAHPVLAGVTAVLLMISIAASNLENGNSFPKTLVGGET